MTSRKLLFTIVVVALAIVASEIWLYAQPRPSAQPLLKQVTKVSPQQLDPLIAESRPLTTNIVSPSVSPATSTSHSIDSVSITPPSIVAGSQTPVVITAQISDSAVIRNSVQLLDVLPTGSTQTIGTLNDNGQNGDLIPDDNIFTITASFAAFPVGVLNLRISAAFSGALLRTQAGPFQLTIEPPISTSTWITLTDAQHLFSIKVPAEWGITVSETAGDSIGAVKVINFEFPDGTIAFSIEVYTTQVWSAIQTSDGGPVPALLGQSGQYVFGESQPQEALNGESISQDELAMDLPDVFATFSTFGQ
jgi:hypothetical protein